MSSTNQEIQQKDANEVEPSEEPVTPLSSDKEKIIEFADLYSIDLACERFGVTKTVLRGWLKQRNIPIKPVYNSPGQGRKISYSKELDSQIADHVRSLLEAGERVSVHDVCTYARKLIQEENPDFTASTGWAQRFLVRNNIDLSFQLRKLIPSNRQTSSNGSIVSSAPDNRGRPLSYPAQLDNSIADWVRQRTAKGDTVTNSELRKHAKEVISKENSSFTGSASWSQNFLLRHRLSLQPTTPTKNEERETTPPREEEGQSGPSALLGGGGATAVVDETVSNTLALLTSEGLPGVVESSLSQGSGISLSDLTNESIIVDLLNNNNHDSTANYSQPSLDSSSGFITLGQHLSDLVSSVNTSTNQNTLELATPTPAAGSTSKSHSSSPGDVIGSGTRPLSYTKETDQQLADWVKDKQATGEKVTFASLRSHARKIVSSENPNFSASVGWVTPFLLRHNLDLKINNRKMKSTRKTSQPRKLSPKDEQSLDETLLEGLGGQGFTDTPSHSTNQNTDDPSQQEEVVMVTEVNEEKVTPKGKVKKGSRSRHTLAEKLEVVRLMREYNLAGHYVSRLLGIATSTLSGWVKLVDQKGSELETLSTNRKRSNRAGQGRPLTYSREKDDMIADWVRQQQDGGVPVTASDLSAYASSLIGEENSTFVASVGWRHKFLQRHNIQLQQLHSSYKPDQATTASLCVPIPVQTEEVICTDEFSIEMNDKPLPTEVLTELLEWARARISDNGSLSVQEFCSHSEEVILQIDPLFVATLGWAFRILHTNGVFLDPKPTTIELGGRKRSSGHEDNDDPNSIKKPCPVPVPLSDPVSGSPPPVTGGTLCQALLSLSQGQEEPVVMETQAPPNQSDTPSLPPSTAKNYFGKLAREFTSEEKEEVVRYANATTLQKAALRYGVAAPTVWRWRMELKLHQPKYTTNQKKYIVKFAETNSLKEAAQRFGITTKTVQNWRRSLQLDGTLSDVEIAAIAPPIMIGTEGEGLTTPTSNGLITEEVIPLDNSHFQFVVDGGEVAEATRPQVGVANSTNSSSLEVVQVQDVGMEYDVVSSEGHAAKPRCTPEEKNHILQYALEHTIREASVKYGVSPGTLYYWKKNHLSSANSSGGKSSSSKGSGGGKSEDTAGSSTGSGIEPTVVSVPMTMDILAGGGGGGGGGLTADPLQSLSSDVLIDNNVPTASLIAAITQTLASATPEQLQSLQQITTDLNLLQAVTSIMSTGDGSVSSRQHEGLGEGISSPTDVLVSFNPLTRSVTDPTNSEPVTMVTEETTTTDKNIDDINSQETEN